MRVTSGMLTAGLILSACTSAPPPPTLDGTVWGLAMFRSSDDTIGTLRPAAPGGFTMVFGKDGQVVAGLDCNRGAGPWRAEPAVGSSSRISIGPLATTRMICPPDPVGDRLARDIDAIRSYRLRDGRLYLMLPADAGVYYGSR
jgi:para-nitrobenzyl esterase